MALSQRTALILALIVVLTVGLTLSLVYISISPIDNHQMTSDVQIDLISEIDTGGGAMSVHVQDDLAFVIDSGGEVSYGLIIIDISDATQPEILGTFHDGGRPFAIECVGDIVYIADQEVGLRIINISDTSNPTQIDGWSGSGSYDVEVIGNLLLVADNDNGLVILDISIPSAPVFVSNYGVMCIHLDAEGDFVYATISGLSVFDISDPEHPILTDVLRDGTGFWDPSVANGMIYLANHNGGVGELQVYDASDPYDIEKISEFDSEGHFQSFAVQESILYAVDYETGLYILDVSNSSIPTEITRFYDGGRPWDVFVDDDMVFLVGSEGLQILQITEV
ncbi:MAG: LVIVD repeat-containing protein [Candidatus Thorarchaeota archaeon]